MKRRKIKQTSSDLVFTIIIYIFVICAIIIVAYPLYFVLIASVSDPTYVNSGDFLLYPKGFNLLGYNRVFADIRIWIDI